MSRREAVEALSEIAARLIAVRGLTDGASPATVSFVMERVNRALAALEREGEDGAAEAALREEWKALRDDALYYDCAATCVRFARRLGLINDAQADTWLAAFKTCPGHDDEGGRSWCAYCGNMPTPPASEATAARCEHRRIIGSGGGPKGWTCEDCGTSGLDVNGQPAAPPPGGSRG